MEEAYLIFPLNRFSFKAQEQIKTAKKVYLIDSGFILAKAFQFSPNVGRLMENLVFVELVRRGCDVNKDIFYYKTRNHKEVDFVLKKSEGITTLIQVFYQSANLDTEEREVKSLIEAGQELNCKDLLIITWDTEKEEDAKGKKIKFIPLWQWLMECS